MKNLKSLLLASLLAVSFVTPAFADAISVQGVAPGGAALTLKVNKNGIMPRPGNDNNDFAATGVVADSALTVTLKAAPGTTTKACLDFIEWSGVATTTAVTIAIKQGSTTIFTLNVPAGATDRSLSGFRPVCGAANAALTAVGSGNPTGSIQLNVTGFTVAN